MNNDVINSTETEEVIPAWDRLNVLNESGAANYSLRCRMKIRKGLVVVKAILLNDEGRVLREALVSRPLTSNDDAIDPVAWANTVAYGKVLSYFGIGGQAGVTKEEMSLVAERLKSRVKALMESGDEAEAQRFALGQTDPHTKRILHKYLLELVSKRVSNEVRSK